MWRFGEVLQPLPQNTRRIDVTVGTAPAEEIRYLSASGGTIYGDGSDKIFIWRTKQNQIELIDFHIRNQDVNDRVVVTFPRHVQVLPYVAVSETERGVAFAVATQASFHLVELNDVPDSSILSDLTSSSFKRSFHAFKVPISVTTSHLTIEAGNPENLKAVLVAASKTANTCTYSLQKNSTTADISELKTQTMFGRLLWAGNADNYKPKTLHIAQIKECPLVISICNDLFIRIWNKAGECLYSAACDQLSADSENVIVKSSSGANGENLEVFLQIGNSIHRYSLYEENGKCMFEWGDSLSPPNELKDFNILGSQVWVHVSDEEVDVIKIFQKSDIVDLVASTWVEVNRPLPPSEYTPNIDTISLTLLQSSRITPSALKSALSQITPDNIPENITQKFLENLLRREAQLAATNLDQFVADFYQLVIEYNDRSISVCGLIGGRFNEDESINPMVLRRDAISVIRPLTGIEAVCSGLPMEKACLNLGRDVGAFLTDIIPIFNRIIFSSGVMESLTEQVQCGKSPLEVSQNFQSDLEILVEESGEGDLLKAEINRLRTTLNAGTYDDAGRIGSVLAPTLKNLLTQIEFSPITKDSCCFDSDIDADISSASLDRLGFLANSIRSVAFNMMNLSQLMLLLIGYIIRTENESDLEGLEGLELELGSIVNNFAVLDWVCSARALWKQKLVKTDNYGSTVNFSTSPIFDSSRLGDASLSASTLFHPTSNSEENLLELWLSHLGEKQVQQLIDLTPRSIEALNRQENILIAEIMGTLQLLSPRNRVLSLPVYFLETNQISLLEDWVALNKNRSTECVASIDYLDGICKLHNGDTKDAIQSFIAASANLTEDFFLVYVLKNAADENIKFLQTSYYLQLMDKFKDKSEESVLIAQLAVDRVDPTDDRISLLWTKVFLLRLDLEDYPSAYSAMTSNPDDDRRKDCLRKFVLHLSERGDLAPLVEAPYGGLEEEITSILENRAIAVSTKDTRYFDLLFAFHITKQNYRQAARAMFLQSQHVKEENDGIRSLEIREAALLSAINCLYLAKPEDQWVSIAIHTVTDSCPKSPKRDYDGNEIIGPLNNDILVTTIEQMETELLVVQARMILAERDIETGALEASEVASLLCKEGLFKDACSLLSAHKIDVAVPIKLLARKYACQISRPDGEELQTQLEELVESEELRVKSTTLYRIAAEEILKIGQMLPETMRQNYLNRDMNEYLRLMAKYGEIDEAVGVACNILDRASNLLENNGARFAEDKNENCLPVLIIEKLNYFTKMNNTTLHDNLSAKMNKYLDTLKNVSRSNVQKFHVNSVY